MMDNARIFELLNSKGQKVFIPDGEWRGLQGTVQDIAGAYICCAGNTLSCSLKTPPLTVRNEYLLALEYQAELLLR